MGAPPVVGSAAWVRESPRHEPACRARVVDVWPLEAGGYAVLLERADETFTLPQRKPPAKPTLRLTRNQRMRLFDGQCPPITGEGACPVEAGESVQLSARVTLEVVRVDAKAGTWKLRYHLRDTRDPVRLLRRTPPAHRDDEYVVPLNAAEAEQAEKEAAEQSGYTSSPTASVADAGEAVPRVWQDVRSKTVSEFWHQERLKRHAELLKSRAKFNRERKRAA